MRSLSTILDRAPRCIPDSVSPLFQPIAPMYRGIRQAYFSRLPEREVRSAWGPKLIVEPSNSTERKIANGVFESVVVQYFRDNIINSHNRFADIGANIGFYYLLFLQEGPRNSVIDCFEPLDKNIDRMRQNFDINNKSSMNIFECALSDEEGVSTLHISDVNPAEATLCSSLYSREKTHTVEIDLQTYDNIYSGLGDPPSLVKIDVEGAEGKVIQGGKQVLGESQPEILLELHPTLLPEFGTSVTDIISILSEIGYTEVVHVESGRQKSIDSLLDSNKYFSDTTHLHLK